MGAEYCQPKGKTHEGQVCISMDVWLYRKLVSAPESIRGATIVGLDDCHQTIAKKASIFMLSLANREN